MVNITENFAVGMRRTEETESGPANTARAFGSGSLEVFATPAMIAIMEKAAANLAAEHLPRGLTSVGVRVDIEHVSATPVGMKVRAEAEVKSAEGRTIVFAVRAFDETGEIGRGIHERAVVEAEKFMARANSKKV